MIRLPILAVLAAVMLWSVSAGAQAPAPKPDWLAYKPPYSGEENDIANPNRTSDEITAWAQQRAADFLTFSPADYKERLAGFKKYFVPAGWQPYAGYLRQSKLINKVTEEGYSVATIVDSPPELLNHSETNGAYRWIVKMPLTVSYFMTADGARTGAFTGKYTLFLDMTRVAEGGDNGIAIQNWRVDETPAKP